ncbi:ankyrin repeat domain-containing protein [Pedobacter sp. AW1-32]|uniref:ankyrin repeat domain-containing protein n=1 Tax=Pedobacter sp. AW1-32 TaxID=3383026 RepID=UPI003FEF1763
MKKIFMAILTIASLAAQAQKNVFLEAAFWKDKPDVTAVKDAIEQGNNPSQMNPMSFDPVVMAINNDAPAESIIYLLSQKGNDLNKLTHDSRTYVFWAASRGNVAVVEYLLKNGAKLDTQDSHGYSPLTFAATAGQQNTAIYDLFIKSGEKLKTDLNHDGANALLIAVPNDPELKLTEYFISKGLDLNSKDAAGNTAVNYAAKGGNIELMKKLIAKGVKYNDNAMILAAQGTRRDANGMEVYKFLESLNIKPTAVGTNGENVLSYIVKRPKQQEIISYFLSKGVDVNQADKDGNTAFIVAAASNRDLPTIELLAKSVKNINQLNAQGVSALAMAVRGNSAEVVAFLLSKGANFSVEDKNGENLAAYLIQGYNPQRVADFEAKLKVLTDKGFDLKAIQKNGNTLYHLALTKNDISLLKRIEPLKIDVNIQNKEGYTALHKAAMTAKKTDILEYLVSIGAKKELKTNFEETPYDLAKENEFLTKNNVSVDFLK